MPVELPSYARGDASTLELAEDHGLELVGWLVRNVSLSLSAIVRFTVIKFNQNLVGVSLFEFPLCMSLSFL